MSAPIVERLRRDHAEYLLPNRVRSDITEAADTITDLLAALELARVYMTDFEGLPIWVKDNPLIQIDAAIAKAKGGAA